MSEDNYFRGKFNGEGKFSWRVIFLRGNYHWGQLAVGQMSGVRFSWREISNYPGDNYPGGGGQLSGGSIIQGAIIRGAIFLGNFYWYSSKTITIMKLKLRLWVDILPQVFNKQRRVCVSLLKFAIYIVQLLIKYILENAFTEICFDDSKSINQGFKGS